MSTTQPSSAPPQEEAGLKKAIRLPQATALVVGIIIGASVFVQPSEITTRVMSVSGIFMVWAASGLLTLFGALICAELASIYPRSGGVYVFLRESFGKPVGFLWGWAMFWTMHTGIIAIIASVFGRYAGGIFALSPVGTSLVAIALVLVISAVNLMGVKQGAGLQTLFTAAKLVAVAFIIVVCFAFGGDITNSALQGGGAASTTRDFTINDFLLAMVAGLFTFGGWHMVTYSAGETVEPRKTIPRALFAGTVIVTVSYILLNAVYLYVLPLDAVASSTRIAADAASAVLGEGAARWISALVMISTFGAVAGVILAGPRVYYAMAQDGLMFKWFGELHPVRGTPDRAIILQAVWAVFLIATNTYLELFQRVIYTEWIFFGLMALGLIVLRNRGSKPDYKVFGYPFVPVIFALAAFTIAINQILSTPGKALIGLGAVLVGLPVYYFLIDVPNRRNN